MLASIHDPAHTAPPPHPLAPHSPPALPIPSLVHLPREQAAFAHHALGWDLHVAREAWNAQVDELRTMLNELPPFPLSLAAVPAPWSAGCGGGGGDGDSGSEGELGAGATMPCDQEDEAAWLHIAEECSIFYEKFEAVRARSAQLHELPLSTSLKLQRDGGSDGRCHDAVKALEEEEEDDDDDEERAWRQAMQQAYHAASANNTTASSSFKSIASSSEGSSSFRRHGEESLRRGRIAGRRGRKRRESAPATTTSGARGGSVLTLANLQVRDIEGDSRRHDDDDDDDAGCYSPPPPAAFFRHRRSGGETAVGREDDDARPSGEPWGGRDGGSMRRRSAPSVLARRLRSVFVRS